MRLLELSSSTHSLLAKHLSKLIIWMTEKMHKNPFLLIFAGKKKVFCFCCDFCAVFSARTHPSSSPEHCWCCQCWGTGDSTCKQPRPAAFVMTAVTHSWDYSAGKEFRSGPEKKSAFSLECEPCNPAVTGKCTVRVGVGILHPKCAAWEATVKFLRFYSPRAAVAAASGLGKEAGKGSMDTETLRATSRHLQWGIWGQDTDWGAKHSWRKAVKVLCLCKQGHTHFINQHYTITSSISQVCHQSFHTTTTGLHTLSTLFMGSITLMQQILNLGALKIQSRAGRRRSHSISSLFGDGKRFVISQFLTYFARVEVKASCDRNIPCKCKEEELHPHTSAWLLQPTSTGRACARRDPKNNFLQCAPWVCSFLFQASWMRGFPGESPQGAHTHTEGLQGFHTQVSGVQCQMQYLGLQSLIHKEIRTSTFMAKGI